MNARARCDILAGVGDFKLRALVIEDDALLSASLSDQLTDWGFDARRSRTIAEARAVLDEAWTLVLLDLALPDGSGMVIADELARRPVKPPLVIAVTGTATVEEGFQLARLGVRAYLPKPLSVPDLRQTIRVLLEKSAESQASLEAVARAEVGSAPYQEIAARVKRAMVERALELAGGNKTGAARLLQVSRQAVQQLIRSLDLPPEAAPRP
jgi:DNA-binding NtrC family response regulator